jgi:hypothetical protein
MSGEGISNSSFETMWMLVLILDILITCQKALGKIFETFLVLFYVFKDRDIICFEMLSKD